MTFYFPMRNNVFYNLLKNEVIDRFPSHLGAFISAYSKVIMNRCIDAFDGFNNRENVFCYTDTDSMILHHGDVEKLQRKKSSIRKGFYWRRNGTIPR